MNPNVAERQNLDEMKQNKATTAPSSERISTDGYVAKPNALRTRIKLGTDKILS